MKVKELKLFSFMILVTIYATGIMGTRMIIPLVSHELGSGTSEVGLIVALYSILPLLLSIKIGKFIDTKKFKAPIFISIVLVGIGLLLPFVFHN